MFLLLIKIQNNFQLLSLTEITENHSTSAWWPIAAIVENKKEKKKEKEKIKAKIKRSQKLIKQTKKNNLKNKIK